VGHRKVLVVEDDHLIREAIAEALDEEGFEVVEAANGREALALLPRLGRPCVIILDVIMPVMSGTECYAAMQADPRLADIPVVVSTSDPSRAPSGVRIMKKPIDLDRLLAMLAALF